ncbi:MAG: hypothetical protein HN742_42090 [Lentisphaerae bacterium]|jgi:alpha-L-fucosidase|nr:hypothetical protein [Lentisphaerota bacterium]MBT4821206.1 hypothetical protein [Lentisphaerota bacterium]MBT5605896.1 hypothetical protein [Lentisphaerota bacterium]MBT7057975.1 hypothetical protein [Lentisphaerota bacterium]MBT7848530.1 hypothetical protein [Lentisphaerota bacterium]
MTAVPRMYKPTWDSLKNVRDSEWLMDAKFGLYAHWGLYAVPASGNEWYGKRMYEPSNPVHLEHCERFGNPSSFGYKDFIPHFTAEHFDAVDWATLFAESGARYGGFSLAHHDGFGLWDSDVHRWCAGKMGPKRDLYGEFAKALRTRNMKLVAPFHILRCFDWWLPGSNAWNESGTNDETETGRAEGWDLFDPEYADLYWNHVTGTYGDFVASWKARVLEVVDRYAPDLLWFDGGRFQDSEAARPSLEILSHYFNDAAEAGRDVAVLNKCTGRSQFNFPQEMCTWTFENGRSRPPITANLWVDDMKIGSQSWGYVNGQTYLSGREITHGLIDRVSRGGGLLLSLSPKADGTIPQGQRDTLRETGTWLNQNGEAIYATRPWGASGEGPNSGFRPKPNQGHAGWDYLNYTADDIRYTQSKDGKKLYAIAFGWPGKTLRLSLVSPLSGLLSSAVENVSLLDGGTCKWEQRVDCLYIDLAGIEPVNDVAPAWCIDLA